MRTGDAFDFGVNLFDMGESSFADCTRVFTALAAEGLGPARSRVQLVSADAKERLGLSIDPGKEQASRVRVTFLTPTEIKGAIQPDFGVLLARIRDRVSTIRVLYGAGPLDIDFKAFGQKAAAVRMTRCELVRTEVSRVSGRTGQRHSLGGFTGAAEYEGDLAPFLPYLEIARWTGVGRHTVWGNGEIAYETF